MLSGGRPLYMKRGGFYLALLDFMRSVMLRQAETCSSACTRGELNNAALSRSQIVPVFGRYFHDFARQLTSRLVGDNKQWSFVGKLSRFYYEAISG